MNGILVYDKKDAEYNSWFIEHMIECADEYGIKISLVLTEDILRECAGVSATDVSLNCREYDLGRLNQIAGNSSFAIVRNRDYKLSEKLEEMGIRCFNSSYVCRIGNDKWEMYRNFQAAGIPVMYTQLSKLPYPFIVKPRNGHGGEEVHLISNKEEYDTLADIIDDRFIYQMPSSEKGRDIRVYVIGENIVTAMERRAADSEADIRANFSLGGSASEYALTDEELRLVAKVAKHINADFVGIDLIYNNGKPVVNEVEDAVGTRMLYAYTDLDPVKIFVEYIKNSWRIRRISFD